MKQLLILSGKGGTGKTTIASSFISLLKGQHKTFFADCDVDVPNLHLIFSEGQTMLSQKNCFGKRAVINQSLCTHCGLCEQHCRFGAMKNGVVNPYLCEGCGVCELVCPIGSGSEKAVHLAETSTGSYSVSATEYGVFSTASLKPGAGATGKTINMVKQNLSTYGENAEIAVIDGSPGIGCPIISSVAGVDLVLLVLEPSLSGLSDLTRILKTVRQLRVPAVACINRSDTAPQFTQDIYRYCAEHELMVLEEIPFDPLVIRAVNHNRPIVDYPNSPAAQCVTSLFSKTLEVLNTL